MSVFQSTLSNAFSRSANTAYTSLYFSIYLSPTVRINQIASLVPLHFLKPNCSSSNSSSILERRRRFIILRRFFAVCDIRLIVLNSLHSHYFSSVLVVRTSPWILRDIHLSYKSCCIRTEFPSSNSSSILERRRRFNILRRIFTVCDIRLIVLNSLHSFALLFFGIGSNTVSLNSSSHSLSLQILLH